MALYTDYKPDLHKKFQVAFTYDINVRCQIWNFYYDLFLSDADMTHTYTDQLLKMRFSNSKVLKTCKFIKISISKILPKNNTFSAIHGEEKIKFDRMSVSIDCWTKVTKS